MSFGLSRGKHLDPSGIGIEWDAVPAFDHAQWIDPRAWFLATADEAPAPLTEAEEAALAKADPDDADDAEEGASAASADDGADADTTGSQVDGAAAASFAGHGRDAATVASLRARLEAATAIPRGEIDRRIPPDRFEIEIGSGKGTFLLQQGAIEPDTWFLGIEYAGEFWRYAADRLRRHGRSNVRLLYGDASEFMRFRAADGICRVIHLYFADPWPKRKHHKRRMVQDATLRAFHRVLIPGGEVRIVTDHADYWAWIEDHARRAVEAGLFVRETFDRPASAGSGEVVGTNFERKYRREGRPFHALVLRHR